MCTWTLPLLLFLVAASAGLSYGHEVTQTHPNPGAQNVGLSALLALMQHQSSSIDRLHEDLTASERKVDSLESQLQTLKSNVEKESAARQQDKGKVDSLESQVQTLKSKVEKESAAGQQNKGKVDSLASQVSALNRETESELKAIKKKVEAASGLLQTKVGFMAKLGSSQRLSSKTVVKLDQVQYNEGNAYNPGTGYFTAPVSGMYTFFLKTEQSKGEVCTLDIMKEGQRALYIYASDGGSYETASGQVLLHLARGQKVYVQTVGQSYVRGLWSTFGGFLVHPDA